MLKLEQQAKMLSLDVPAPTPLPSFTERDEGEFARLSQLGDVLGLTQMDVYQVRPASVD